MSVPALAPDDTAARVDWRRRAVVLVTLVLGAVLLHLAFAQPSGSSAFYDLTLALAVTGTTGALLSGPIPLLPRGHRLDWPRDIAVPIAFGAVVAGVFIGGAAVVDLIHPLRRYVDEVVTHTHGTSFALILFVTLANAIAEEVFFRGAVYAAVGPRWRVALTTLVYVATISIAGNPALAFAAAVLGTLLGLQRRIVGGVLAPALTHATWSAGLLIVLPLLVSH